MKKILVVLAVAGLAAACSSKTNNAQQADGVKKVYYTTSAADADRAKNAKYQIIDQEFDNMLAPDSDYETLSDYELQACGASYLPPAEKLKKPQAVIKQAAQDSAVKEAAASKVTKNKKVTNTTNIYYIDAPAPTAPVRTSSTTTTTYSSDGTVLSTTTK